MNHKGQKEHKGKPKVINAPIPKRMKSAAIGSLILSSSLPFVSFVVIFGKLGTTRFHAWR
jgi:hypothetical protein